MWNRLSIFALLCLLGCTHAAKKSASLPDTELNDATTLIEKAAQGNADDVGRLLKKGEKPNQANSQGITALMVAARKGHVTVLKLLLEAKADPNLLDEQGSTALHYAALGAQSKAVDLLIEHGAHVNTKDGFDLTPLMIATRFADLATIKALLRGKANVNEKDENGWSALFFTIPRGDSEIFDMLADRTGELDGVDSEGDGMVATAIQYKQYPLLRTLVDRHAPASIANKKGITPMRLAIESDDIESVRILSKHVALTERLANGRTPLMLAIDLRQQDIAKLLFALNADLNAKDGGGKSGLDHLNEAGLDQDWLH